MAREVQARRPVRSGVRLLQELELRRLARRWKDESVRVVATTNLVLSGRQTISGVPCVPPNRILVAGQTLGQNNGIYECRDYTWFRTRDAEHSDMLPLGTTVIVEEGVYAGRTWRLQTPNVVLGTTVQTWAVDDYATNTALASETAARIAGDALLIPLSQRGTNNGVATLDGSGKLTTSQLPDLAAADAMIFKGVIDCSSNPNYPAADRGHTYRVSVAGKIGGASGTNVEAGDLLLCITDATASGDQATVGTAWSIAQTNIDGAVTGPASSTSGNLPTFNGTGGKVLQDSGTALSSLAPKASPTFTGVATSPVWSATGLTGAVTATRYVGGTASGAPVTGTFTTGDWIITAAGNVWICTVGGTPGTWAQSGSGTYAPLTTVLTKTGGGLDTVYSLGNITGATTANLANGNMQYGTLTGNVTFTFSGATNGSECEMVLSLTQDGTGSRTITWPASVKWAGGVGPTISTAASANDQFVFRTRDGGTTWYGALIGKGFA